MSTARKVLKCFAEKVQGAVFDLLYKSPRCDELNFNCMFVCEKHVLICNKK